MYDFSLKAREGGRMLQSLSAHERSTIIEKYALSLLENSKAILDANKLDLDLAKKNSKHLPNYFNSKLIKQSFVQFVV